MKPSSTSIRDRGLALIARVNRWMIGGAVALSGVLSLVAANAFHGHTARAATPTPSPSSAPASSGSASNTGNTGNAANAANTGNTGGLQAPDQGPSAAPPSQGPVVSGGS